MDLLLANAMFGVIRKDLDELEKELLTAVASPVDLVTEIGTHLVKSGGKRLRPALFFLAAHHASAFDRPRVMPLAVAIELIHMASLVHDDVLDHADTRRGTPTANAKWGNQISILSGDYIFARAFAMIAGRGYDERISVLLSQLICDLSVGEIIQNKEIYKASCDVPEYYERIARKTANFLAVCCEMGAIVAEQDEATIQALRRYGYAIGMAFQITDDLLDLTATKKDIGKPAGNDILQGIVTLPVIRALEISPRHEELHDIVTDRNMTQEDLSRALAIVRASDGLDFSRQKVQDYLQEAKAALPPELPEDIRKAYQAAADYIGQRKS
jgi:heptaprenyl diphosphate synthase